MASLASAVRVFFFPLSLTHSLSLSLFLSLSPWEGGGGAPWDTLRVRDWGLGFMIQELL